MRAAPCLSVAGSRPLPLRARLTEVTSVSLDDVVFARAWAVSGVRFFERSPLAELQALKQMGPFGLVLQSGLSGGGRAGSVRHEALPS